MFVSRINTPEPKRPKTTSLLGFPRTARITRGAELQRITQEGKRFRTKLIEVRVAAAPLGLFRTPEWKGLRIGLIVPRFKQTAVMRNRLKRRLRELSRLRLLPSDLTADVVLRIRPEAYEASFELLAREMINVRSQLEDVVRNLAGLTARPD